MDQRGSKVGSEGEPSDIEGMSDVRDPSEYSPASSFPGSDSHVEMHGPAHGSWDHNSNGIGFHGPVTDYPVEDHQTTPTSW